MIRWYLVYLLEIFIFIGSFMIPYIFSLIHFCFKSGKFCKSFTNEKGFTVMMDNIFFQVYNIVQHRSQNLS